VIVRGHGDMGTLRQGEGRQDEGRRGDKWICDEVHRNGERWRKKEKPTKTNSFINCRINTF